jgi:hypothetical protein
MVRVLSTYETENAEPLTKGVKLNPEEPIFLLVDEQPPAELVQALANRCPRLTVLVPKIKRGFWMCASWPLTLDAFARQKKTKTLRFDAVPLTALQAQQHLDEIQ